MAGEVPVRLLPPTTTGTTDDYLVKQPSVGSGPEKIKVSDFLTAYGIGTGGGPGLWNDRGAFDASGGAYPSSGGSGTAGAILKGNIWTISVAGTLPTAQVVEVGDTVRALVDTPGNTQANWAIAQNNIGYVPENVANKSTTLDTDKASNTKYSTPKSIYDWGTGLFAEILTAVNFGAFISGLTGKTTPVDADYATIMDSADSSKAKKVSWANIKATLKTYFDGIYQAGLVSGTSIKTLNGNSLLGSGNLSVQPVLVSGTNLKTVNGNSLLGSGDLSISSGGVSKGFVIAMAAAL